LRRDRRMTGCCALVMFSLTDYFLHGPTQRGITYEALRAFEQEINDQLGTGNYKVHVVISPVARNQLIPLLLAGKGDIAAANLTITPDRRELVDFSLPGYSGVEELVVTVPAVPEISALDDLSGMEVHVRVSSSYYETIVKLNKRLRETDRKEVRIVPADEHFEDEDLLQMVDAEILPAIVVDSHMAPFWEQNFENVKVRSDLAIRTGGEVTWAFRKNSSVLAKVVNAFIVKNRQETLLGNPLLKRYLHSTKWV
jgi:membrane-bound lytic murein transglycosylase MltF